ncbi:AbgT family transporter [Arenimonas caeni]|jgi:aminobenzoyl-glutamate transport protein|uniref:AbgT family transporter n=1 Tax=Arenimonas caeni TaxID=2058085 RepID=UPI002A36F8B5|nr:AbgT family transporter [Arenimonas caeni]MDY0023285.1 AbgT family transporter [Arenimonas caeni]
MTPLQTPRRSAVDRFLGVVEFAGNLLPHPATLFFLLTVAVVVASAITAQFDLAVPHPKTGELVAPVNLQSVDGLQRI